MVDENWNRLYLTRHGENQANLTNEFSYKRVDYPLTQKGMLQALQTAIFFRNKRIDAIFSSPLKRAIQTGTIIGQTLNLGITVIENFREVNVGELEVFPSLKDAWKLHNQIFEDWLSGRPEARFPGGEDYFSLIKRVQSGVMQIVANHKGKHFVIVGHAGIFTATIKDLCRNVDIEAIRRQEKQNCSITTVDAFLDPYNILRAELKNWASTTHLY